LHLQKASARLDKKASVVVGKAGRGCPHASGPPTCIVFQSLVLDY
jgi:hypothetical protein